jgi:hypothetical protein
MGGLEVPAAGSPLRRSARVAERRPVDELHRDRPRAGVLDELAVADEVRDGCSERSVFSATRAFCTLSWASYTTPTAPSPTRAWSSKRPEANVIVLSMGFFG